MTADHVELEGFTDPPPEASVRLDITAHLRPLEIVDRAEADIELDIVAKVHLRTREKPKIGIVPCRFATGEVDMHRSEERRVGIESVSTCRSRWAPDQ